jgi:hypothetical protein
VSQHQLRHRAFAAFAATAGALAPVADLLAKRRPRRDRQAAEDEDHDDLIRRRLRRRRNEQDDDDDDRLIGLARARRRRNATNDENDTDAGTDAANNPQGIVADLGIRDTVQERIDNVLFGGGGGGDDEPNIEVSEDGDSIIVVTKDISFAADSEGLEVETGGISYVSGAGGGVLDDFES